MSATLPDGTIVRDEPALQALIAEKAAREKRLAEVCKREAERRQEADRQKAAVERAKAESQLRE